MLLALDVGNTQIFAGVFDKDLLFRFRKSSQVIFTADELGLFLRQILREHEVSPNDITAIAVSSVVPDLSHTIATCARKYFGVEPFFIRSGIKTGIKITTVYGEKLGADRLSDLVGAQQIRPDENLIVLDFGTANTYDALSKDKEYKGGCITAGLGTRLKALCLHTALLPKVEIVQVRQAGGLSTEEQMQAGLYYGQLGELKELVYRLRLEAFKKEKAVVIATGGFARLFEKCGLFDIYEPDLVLHGIKKLWQMNQETPKRKTR